MVLEHFSASLAAPEPPPGLSPALVGLWHRARGEWDRAHETVQAHEGDSACDWVHAHLHRLEGDLGNAAYWYRRARKPMAEGDLEAEWRAIAAALLAERA
jgi:hypothetical protein